MQMTIQEKINFDISERINSLHRLQTDENDCLCVMPDRKYLNELVDRVNYEKRDIETVAWTLKQLGYNDKAINIFKNVAKLRRLEDHKKVKSYELDKETGYKILRESSEVFLDEETPLGVG